MELVKPELEVIRFDDSEVIVTSGCGFDLDCSSDDPEHCENVCAGVCEYNACASNR